MKTLKPRPKNFDISKYRKLINGLNPSTPELEFERSCEIIVYDILKNYEVFSKIEKGPDFRGTPFDFFGFKNGDAYIIEFKGSLKSFNAPGETQKRRLKEILNAIGGVNVALLQVKLLKGEYRIFYDGEMEILFRKRHAPIEPIVDWISHRINRTKEDTSRKFIKKVPAPKWRQMGQTATGVLTEQRVLDRLNSFGLVAYKPIPDQGVDIEAHLPDTPEKVAKIQVKGRNPKKDPNLRWFQIRVRRKELEKAKAENLDPNQTWIDKVNSVDFFILDAVKVDEMWVLPREKVFELIKLNETRYRTRPDNIFNYDLPLKQKQKEMNLDVEVDGVKLTEIFNPYLDNFDLILQALDSPVSEK
jgi:hypothetical protein